MKKSLIALVLISLLAGACTSLKSSLISNDNAPQKKAQSATMAKAPEKQFLQVLYNRDLGRFEFEQYLRSIGTVDSQEKQDKLQKKSDQVSISTLNSLKELRPTDPEVKTYLEALISLAQLSDKVNSDHSQLAVEYQKNKKLSADSQKKLNELGGKLEQVYSSTVEQEIKLIQKYANQTSGVIKDFMHVQSILNNELVEASALQQKLLKDSSIKSQVQFDKKASPGMIKITGDVASMLGTVHSEDAALAAYVSQLIEAYQIKLKMMKQAQAAIGKKYKPNADLLSRYRQLNMRSEKMRIDLLRQLMN